MTVDQALLRYEQHQRAKGNKVKTIDHNLWRLRVWLSEDQAIADITPKQLQAKYDQRVAKLAADSHRGELAVVKTFFNWAVKEGLISKSPADRVEPVGRRRRGKKQLRKSEAQAFAARALLMAQAGDDGALAALAVLLLGLRSGEIRKRRVRDLDPASDAVLLWIEDGKTDAATRHMEVPEPLAGLLVHQAGDREAQGYLFFAPNASAGYRSATWLRKAVTRVCKAAKVPRVCPHGLRGTWATLTTDAGMGGHLVARELGHTNQSVTRDHYTQKGTAERARARGLRLVEG